MRIRVGVLFFAVVLDLGSAVLSVRAENASAPPMPRFAEVYDLVRSNLSGMSETELNRAAVAGFVSQLQGEVSLATNSASADAGAAPLVSKTIVFDGAYLLVRIGRVAPGLNSELTRVYDQSRATNKLKGLIVDLRYSGGQDYASAAATADLFLKDEQPLLQWSDTMVRSTPKSAAIELPMAVLINRSTTGAAEALAAVLRQADGAVLIGSPSAGQAYLFKEFPLSNGQTLRIASGWISVGEGQKLSDKGLTPDITVAVSSEDEKVYFSDPYKVLARPLALFGKPGTNDLASAQTADRSRHRRNEADLVRMQRDGIDLEADLPPPTAPQFTGPTLTDPAMSRALDLLKGLSLALKRR